MAQLLRTQFHKSLSETFVREVQLLKANYYYYLGKISDWGNPDAPPVSMSLQTYQAELETRNNLVYIRKLTPNDVTLVIKKYVWESGTTYSRWDDSIEMKDLKFYVISSLNRVYKCLDTGASTSTVEPTGTSVIPFVTADGYQWKYMYTVPSFKNYKFSSNEYFPVQKAVSDSFYNIGSIEDTIIVNGGLGYTTASISVIGDGTGATFTPVIESGVITDILVDTQGSNYSYAELVITGDGSGASATTKIGLNDIVSDQSTIEQLSVPGAIHAIRITDAGTGYIALTPPAVVITGDGTGATATATVVAGNVTKITMNTYGSGYTNAVVTVASPGGSDTRALAVVINNPYGGHGYDAPSELFSDTVCISSVLSADTALNTIAQDYRQYGLLKNPQDNNNRLFTSQLELLCYKVKFNSTSGLANDMILINEGHRFAVASFDASNAYLQSLSNTRVPPLGTLLQEGGGSTFVSSEIISSPSCNKYSGSLMSIANETPFTFTAEQNIALKTFIKL